MGIAFKEIIISKEISLEELKGKILVVDSYNLLYQFLTTIRAADGTLLADSKGNVTSHLVGLFSRTTKLMECGIRLAFVFDGTPPALKQKERERRRELKIEAQEEYKKAAEMQDIEAMKKYASRTSRLTENMIEESKKLVLAMGAPIVQAPSEGEAQAAYIVKKGGAFSTVSQDFDGLINGSTRLIRNLSIVGKRKMANKLAYETVEPEIISLDDNLKNLGINIGQLICLAMLVGTDYNTGGIKGIGPKNALKLVRKHGDNFDALFKEAQWNAQFDFPWADVFNTIKDMPVTDDYTLEWKAPDAEKLMKFLVDEHDFSIERVESSLKRLTEEKAKNQQKGLSEFF